MAPTQKKKKMQQIKEKTLIIFWFCWREKEREKDGAKNHENVLSFTDAVMNRPERAQPKSANYCLKI